MDFADEIKQLSQKVVELKNSITTEEATKTALIMPFFLKLGYDVFNPKEFVPEYVADYGVKKGEKADYAILLDGKPVILVEAKCVGENLDKHGSQLFRYFGTTKAKFAILTDGVIYRFFTDIETTNIMDKEPFLEINMLNINDEQIIELQKFSKELFNAQSIFENSRHLKYKRAIKRFLSNQLINPSGNFIKLTISGISEVDTREEAIEELRPLVRTCFAEFINEHSKNTIAIENTPPREEGIDVEQEVLAAIRKCVGDVIEPGRLSLYRVTKWTSVYYRNCALCKIFTVGKDYCDLVFLEKFNDPSTNWKNRKNVITYGISSVSEISNYRDDFIESAKDIDWSFEYFKKRRQERKQENL